METNYYKHLIFNSNSSHLDVPPMDNQPVFLIFTKAHLISKINLYFKGKLPHIVEIYNNNLCVYFSCPYHDYSSLLSHQINYSIWMQTNSRKFNTTLYILLNSKFSIFFYARIHAIRFLSSHREIWKKKKKPVDNNFWPCKWSTDSSTYRYPCSYISGCKAAWEEGSTSFLEPNDLLFSTHPSAPIKCLSVATFPALEIIPPWTQLLLKITQIKSFPFHKPKEDSTFKVQNPKAVKILKVF